MLWAEHDAGDVGRLAELEVMLERGDDDDLDGLLDEMDAEREATLRDSRS